MSFSRKHPYIDGFLSPLPLTVLLSIALLGFAWFHSLVIASDKESITSWVANRNDTAIEVSLCVWSRGPFYFAAKHHRIYCVVTEKGNEYWFRTGNWGADDIEQSVNGHYVTIQ